MIQKIQFSNLRNAEYFQFMSSAHDVFVKLGVEDESFACLRDEMGRLLAVAETAMIAERRNTKVAEKNEADRRRDRLHSKLFNYLKYILYDERDPRFDDAQTVMEVVKAAGNPTRMAENAQSAMMTALGNRLEPLAAQLEAIGAAATVAEMMEANRNFIAVEADLREMLAAQKLDDTPASMSAARRQIDPVYRAIVNTVNAYCGIPSRRDAYRELVAEMNVLAARYDALLAARRRTRNETATATAEVAGKCEC